VIHRCLELMTRTPPSITNDVRQQVATEFQFHFNDTGFNEWHDEARRVLHHPGFQSLFDSTRYQTAYNEVALVYERDNKVVHGVMDRVLVSKDQIVLIDYKTRRAARPDNLSELADQYREQMLEYTEGLRHMWPTRTVRSLLLFTTCCATFEIATDARQASVRL
jgi:ATP-dependent helicase/nuclease subunit A